MSLSADTAVSSVAARAPAVDVPPELAAALGSPDTLSESDTLQLAVCEYVRKLKGAGLPPERVLVTVKERVARAGLPRRGSESDVRVVERIVRWSVDEYYREAKGTDD